MKTALNLLFLLTISVVAHAEVKLDGDVTNSVVVEDSTIVHIGSLTGSGADGSHTMGIDVEGDVHVKGDLTNSVKIRDSEVIAIGIRNLTYGIRIKS